MVSVEFPEPLSDDGEKLQLTPLGSPVHANVTVPLNPPTDVSVTVEVAEVPGATVAGESAFAETRKSSVGGCAVFNTITTPAAVVPPTSTATSGRRSPLKSAIK